MRRASLYKDLEKYKQAMMHLKAANVHMPKPVGGDSTLGVRRSRDQSARLALESDASPARTTRKAGMKRWVADAKMRESLGCSDPSSNPRVLPRWPVNDSYAVELLVEKVTWPRSVRTYVHEMGFAQG